MFESADEFPVDPVTEDSPGLTADGSEPTVDTGLELEVVEPEGLLDEPEFVPVGVEEIVDPCVELVDSDVFVDPGVELVDSDVFDDSDELDDESESFGAAHAAPIPAVPTKPMTPSENATAPIRNASFFELMDSESPVEPVL